MCIHTSFNAPFYIIIECVGTHRYRKNAIILYDESRARDAIRLAKDFRAKAKHTELIKKSPEKGLEDYIRFGKEYYAGSLVYIKKSGEITMVNLVTGEQKEVNNNK